MLTRNATIFGLLNSVTTVIFLITLNNLVTTGQFQDIALWAVAYGLTWAMSGALLGMTDKTRNYRGSVDFQYTAVSSIVGLFTLWGSKLFLSAIMPISYPMLALLSAALIIATGIQYHFANRNPKGIDKNEAFK